MGAVPVFEAALLGVAVLVFVSVLSSKLSDRFAIPSLLLFLAVGMLAGSEGIGGVQFDNPHLAKSIGVVALIFIIFSGGLDTRWEEARPVWRPALLLSTLGVAITAVTTGLLAVLVLKFSMLEGMVLGAIVSSTDAAAVFSILRSKRIGLKQPLRPLLEFESASNDPMALFLTVGFIGLLTRAGSGLAVMAPALALDMGMGAATGWMMARFSILLIKRLRLEYDGLYPVVMVSLVLMTYAIAVFVKGNGILAVYLAGLLLGKAEFPNKKMIVRFHDGVAWLMQIVMFVTFGLLVFPSHIVPLAGRGLLLTLLLMVLARPLSVFLCLAPFKLDVRRKALLSWVGLKGSVPIILATFPYEAGLPQADAIFNVVFFVVFASVLIQGTSIPLVAKLLGLDAPLPNRISYPIEFERTDALDAELTEVIVPFDSEFVGRPIREVGVPGECLIVLISRGERFVIPAGSTVIESGDVLLVLANLKDLADFQHAAARLAKKPDEPAERT